MIDLNQMSHSNDSLEIIQYNKIPCVKKIFNSDIIRAQRNVLKQQNFKSLHTGTIHISAAEIISFEKTNDEAILIMPYIDGITGDTLSIYASRHLAYTLSSALSTMLLHQISTSDEEDISITIFVNKLNSVLSQTKDNELKRLIEISINKLEEFPREIIFPIGKCHGDLTLSNIILDPVSGITLIDFLDTYFESPLQDVAKLKQDFDYGWSFRNSPSNIRIKSEILCAKNYPVAINQIERMYPTQVKILMLVTLARIAPYVKDEVTKLWLIKSLEKCIGEF